MEKTKDIYLIDTNELKTQAEIRDYTFRRAMAKLDEIKEAEKAIQEAGLDEEKEEEIREENEPLAIDWEYRLTIELSTGGDADGFILRFDKDKELIGGAYYWADWGKYQEIELRGEEAEAVFDFYLMGDAGAYLV